MDEAWYTEVADELARCLIDAARCADACERLLNAPDGDDVRIASAVIVPAAVANVLIELIDEPRPLIIAAAKVCRDSARDAAARLEALDGRPGLEEACAALRACAESCDQLLDA